MEERLVGYWHRKKLRCHYCGRANVKGDTFIVNTSEIKGQFCSARHAQEAWGEMKRAKAEGKI